MVIYFSSRNWLCTQSSRSRRRWNTLAGSTASKPLTSRSRSTSCSNSWICRRETDSFALSGMKDPGCCLDLILGDSFSLAVNFVFFFKFDLRSSVHSQSYYNTRLRTRAIAIGGYSAEFNQSVFVPEF